MYSFSLSAPNLMIRVAIIDDDAVVREGLCEYLDQQPDFKCVLVADAMESALATLPTVLHIDVILLDLGLPGMNGLDGMPHLRNHYPQVDIIVLTVYHDANRIYQALCAGATGYLLKSTPLSEIRDAIATVRGGGSVMSPDVARKVLAHFQPVRPAASSSDLTAREREIVDCLIAGLSYKLIADHLDLSIDTVRFHFRNIYKKLHINSQIELMAKVLRKEV
jgi:DNA-binding NarL/FixJ family response regulator